MWTQVACEKITITPCSIVIQFLVSHLVLFHFYNFINMKEIKVY